MPHLLLALNIVASASAAVPHRCDVSWLKQAQAIVSRGGIPSDPNHYLTTMPIPGGERTQLEGEGRPKVCDAAVWRYLFESEAGLALGWRDGLGNQVKILLSVDALYHDADSQDVGVVDESSEALSKYMSGLVLSELELTWDYGQLRDLYDEDKASEGWAESPAGLAVAATMKILRADAESTRIADGQNGRMLWYGVGGQMVPADGIVVGKLSKSYSYRDWAAGTIAKNIISNPFDALTQVALDDYRRRHDAFPASR